MVFWWFSLLWIIRNSHSLWISTGDFFSANSIVQFTLSGFGLWREGREQQQVVVISGVYTQQFASSSRTETRREEREGPLGRQHKHTQIRAGTLNELENKKKSKSWSFWSPLLLVDLTNFFFFCGFYHRSNNIQNVFVSVFAHKWLLSVGFESQQSRGVKWMSKKRPRIQ